MDITELQRLDDHIRLSDANNRLLGLMRPAKENDND